ncbi:MAG TPA: hypothetical protein DEG47_02040 [Cyanobacteria bacterium UBA11148]|nr:hypothetical protein [Cyanobacteria bacterium UBA11148]
MKAIFRFLSLTFAAGSLIILTNCNQTPSPSNTSNSSPTAESSPTATTADKTTSEENDINYMTKLGLMKGHMLVAKELLDLGKTDQAEPHVGHPIEEIYSDVEDELKERNVPEFKTELTQLHDFVKSNPKDAKLETNFNQSMESIDKAIEVLPESQRQSPEFILQVINNLLETAGAEYEAAIADGKFSEIIEYQDSRGFVNYADSLHKSIADQLSKDNAEIEKAIAENLTQLKTAWPSALAPETPVLSPEKVTQLIETIEEDSQKLIKG